MTDGGDTVTISGCPCGAEHQAGADTAASYARVTAGLPPSMPIRVGRSAWLVPRVYVAMHGLTATDLPRLAGQYGWPPAV